MRRETMNNSGIGWGDGVMESMDGRGTSQGGYGATALMDRRDTWKQVCLKSEKRKSAQKMEKRKGKGNRQNNAAFLKEKIEQRVV
ncbi:unnamed protein product [Cochlearia groenlandica]